MSEQELAGLDPTIEVWGAVEVGGVMRGLAIERDTAMRNQGSTRGMT
jgi:hypothetical protein